MCVYVVVLVGCCCICGGPHLTRLSLRAAAWDSRNPLQFANELSVKAHAGTPAAERKFALSRPLPLSWAVCPHRMCEARARVRNFYGGPASCRPRGRSNSKGTTLPAAKCQTNVLSTPGRAAQPGLAQPAHAAAAIAATGRRRRPCEACRPKAASLTVHIGPAHLLASGCWPKLIGN